MTVMNKPEPLSDEEITAIWNRFIKQPYDGRTLSAIISHTAQAVAARYEARENHRARTVAKLVEDLASMAASREQWKSCAETLIGAGERREARIAERRDILISENEQIRAQHAVIVGCYEARIAELERERDALRADAERYRCLRNRDLNTIDVGGVFAGMTPQNVVLNGADLDDAVDATRAAQGKANA